VTVYTTMGPDPLWMLLAIGAAGSLIAGTLGRSRVGTAVARRLVVAGALLVIGLVAYSLFRTWSAPLPAANAILDMPRR
jgi:hypothetical protein